MKEIKIQNTNLFIKEMDIGGVSSYILGSDKKKMRYQFAVVEDTANNKLTHIFTYDIRVLNFRDNNPKKLYLLLKERKKFDKDIKLDKEEAISVLKFLSEFVYYYPQFSEPIIKAVRDQELLNKYNYSYGPAITSILKPYIKNMIQNPDNMLNFSDNSGEFFWKDTRRNYSILDFLKEFKNDPESRIKIIPDIIQYNRISPKSIDTSNNLVEYLDIPGEIVSLSGSKSRANMNITYKTYVNITTPNGQFYENYSMLKNYCVIKDGQLNTKFICVKINSKLAGKLKRLKVVYTKLGKNTYILDLTKLPVFSKGQTYPVQSWMLEQYEYYYQCYKFQAEYIKFLIEKSSEKVEETSLEIDTVKKEYNPRVSRKSNGYFITLSYEPEILDKVFPKNSNRRKIIFNNSGTLSQDSTPYKLISEIDNSSKSLRTLLKEVKKKEKYYSELLANAKFKLIMTKDCIFNRGFGKVAYGRNMTLKGKYGEIKLIWNIKEQKIYTYEKR